MTVLSKWFGSENEALCFFPRPLAQLAGRVEIQLAGRAEIQLAGRVEMEVKMMFFLVCVCVCVTCTRVRVTSALIPCYMCPSSGYTYIQSQ